MISDNHYSSYYCHFGLNNELNIEANKSFYCNSLIDNGKIELIQSFTFAKIISSNKFSFNCLDKMSKKL